MGKGKMGKGSAGAFSEEQTEMYRECFKLMDIDKDGAINKNDLRAAFDNVGKILNEFENYLALLFINARFSVFSMQLIDFIIFLGMLMSEAELDNMLGEIGGPCNFENMLKCFEVKLTGEGMANDGDELVLEAMKAYNETSKKTSLYLI